MINDFNDFCTWMYVVVDDIWLKIAPFFKRPGPAPECPDSELLTMAIIGECRGWDLETEMLSQWQEHRDLRRRGDISCHPDTKSLQSAAAWLDAGV
jgi:hypothetical protein